MKSGEAHIAKNYNRKGRAATRPFPFLFSSPEVVLVGGKDYTNRKRGKKGSPKNAYNLHYKHLPSVGGVFILANFCRI